jgi:dipeptidyl-peptidase-4
MKIASNVPGRGLRVGVWVLTSSLLSLPGLSQEAPVPLTLDDTFGSVSFYESGPSVRWAGDGATLQVGSGEDVRYLDPATLEALEAPGEDRPRERTGPDRVRMRGGKLTWIGTAEDGTEIEGEREFDAGGAEEFHLAPGGGHVSFVRDNDLFTLDTSTGEVTQHTTGGGPELFHGMLDWVYQEELYGRGDFQGHWWSPTGERLAFLRLDESPVKEFTVVDHAPDPTLEVERAVVAEVTNYPKAGDPNPFASLWVASVDGRDNVELDLSAYPNDRLIVRVGWKPAGDKVVFIVQDRIQTWAALCFADPTTGVVREILRESSPTWVNRPPMPRWLDDGSFLWESERTGYNHVYHYAATGDLVRAVTAGDWQVRRIEHLDEERGLLWFEGTREDAVGRHDYRIGLDGQGLVALTPGRGTHETDYRDDRRYLIDRVSHSELPGRVVLRDGETGEELSVLSENELSGKHRYFTRERVTIPARDGYPLDGTVIVPDGPGPHPVFLATYSGPDAPSVRDSFSRNSWHQFLAQEGCLVLQVNVRSASNRGQVHTGSCYKQLLVQELEDLEDAVDWVSRQRGGDASRVAISGWSFGGSISAYALCNSDKFQLGFAGAGVYDWRLYDTIYTERYMSTPQLNPEGYNKSSVLRSAEKLNGHLVLFHGTMDDNVHLQNTILLLDALQKAGHESFELMLYPKARHGVRSPHLRRMTWRVLDEQFNLTADTPRGGTR